MNGNDDTFIQQVVQVLDAHPADADARAALQRARGNALTTSPRARRRIPWLPFAVTASLLTVLALNLPQQKPHTMPQKPAVSLATGPAKASAPAASPAKPAQQVQKNPVESANADADLLENLDMYEDAEFYQWLSEQSGQGAHDA
jgi:hypothetical protein